MSKISEIIYLLDKATFIGLRNALGGGWLDGLTTYTGQIVLWVPLFALLAIYLSMSRPRNWWLEVFFGLAAFILSFQDQAGGRFFQWDPATHLFSLMKPSAL